MKNYLELVELMEALAARATSGPFTFENWLDCAEETVYLQSEAIGTVARVSTLADAEFIAEARQAVPELCAAVRELMAENARLKHIRK